MRSTTFRRLTSVLVGVIALHVGVAQSTAFAGDEPAKPAKPAKSAKRAKRAKPAKPAKPAQQANPPQGKRPAVRRK